MSSNVDAIVVGGGQSGLAAAHHLTHAGLQATVLEAGPEPVGSWPHYYDSLTLFSPARYSSLPGRPFPGDPDHYPDRDEVVEYLRDYATHLSADIRTDIRVTTATPDSTGFAVHTDTGEVFTAPLLIAATGGFGNPHRPDLPGRDRFVGTVMHAADYRTPARFADHHVVVVGAGNSAVQIAVELAETAATVTLAARRPPKVVAQQAFGRDIHYWFTRTGLDTAPVGRFVERPPTVPIFDTGHYKSALAAGRPAVRPMFTGLDTESAHWPDGTTTPVQTVITATGYRPDLGWLTGLGALTTDGAPRHREGLSTTHPGLGYLGLEWQRSLSSASLRGVGRDAARLVTRLARTPVSVRGSAEWPGTSGSRLGRR
ncbi:flavin-containing monooxygenase [Nocardia shimofusensis]|uniref:flavin-containing monooxygenase n=1 Tax=Nocardia shimofusensis TaxID=228596 RepID=UPI000A02A3D4|nr:NAD(P)-binding domain-containing protein [Nocardia shimofusensis]